MKKVFTICTFCLRAMDENQNPICSLFDDKISERDDLSHGCCNECKVEQQKELAQFKAARAAKNLVSVS